MRILIVEDNPDDVRMTLRAIKRSGVEAEIQVAQDGAEALEVIRSSKPAPTLILLDVKLPKISGIEVLRAIKSDSALKSIPTVMLTSSDETKDLAAAYSFGANSYLQKPVEYEKFIVLLNHAGLYWTRLNIPPPAHTNHREHGSTGA